MQAVNQKNDLFAGQNSQSAGKAAFICPGGIISKAVLAASGKPAAYWRDVYLNADKLYQLAKAMHDLGRTDNYAVPLCLTVEAELFGAQVDYCASLCELKIREYPFLSLEELLKYEGKGTGRREVVLQVISRLRAASCGALVFGTLTGPLTLLSQLLEPKLVFKAMLRHQALLHRVLQKLLIVITSYGQKQLAAGADILVVGEPVANGDILGAGLFAEFVTPYLNKLFQTLNQVLPNPQIVLHICGRVNNLLPEFKKLPFSILSVDAKADIKALKQAISDKIIIGSVCTNSLAKQTPARIKALAQKVINQGAAALCLPCGLNPATPLNNLQAMRQAIYKDTSGNK